MANGVIEVSQLDILSQSGTGITTVVPPATNTNRTLTLPDETGTVLVNGTTSNVGIGTSSPANKLEVSGAIVAQGAATAYTNTGLYLQNKGSSVFDVGAWRSGASVAELTFSTDSGSDAAPVERMRIDSSGNVGIGTSNPTTRLQIGAASNTTTDYPLTINNSANNYGVQVGAYGMSNRIYGASTVNYDFDIGGVAIFKTNNAERMRITSTGDVGIGTAAPQELLHLQKTGGSTIRFQNPGVWVWNIGNNSTSFVFYDSTAAAERMRIDSSGNVGIGTASPVKRLTISGASNGNITTLTDAATITPNLDSSDMFTVTLGGNRTLANPSNIDAGQTGSIFIVQDGTGSRTLAWGSYWDFAGGTAPTLSTAAGAVDRVDFIVRTSTSIHAVFTANYS